MLEVYIRLFNANRPGAPSYELSVMRIANDGTGDESIGNYDWQWERGVERNAYGRIEGFDRRRGAEALVAEALAGVER